MASQPHLLIITIDSLRADYIGPSEKRSVSLTPNMDAFRAQSVSFTQHLSSMAVTLPSHTSLMTGCTPAVHGVLWNGVDTPRRRTTIAEIANQAGYRTGAITSWGGFAPQKFLGFTEAFGEGGAAAETNIGEYTLERARNWLKKSDPSRPQFLWVHFIDPHGPDNCPPPYPRNYDGEVQYVDHCVGEFLGSWKETLGEESTLAVITADHGEHLGEHGCPRGHGTMWACNLHIPLMIRFPGRIRPGTVVTEFTRQIDVMPTLLDYTGLPMPYNVEGISMRGLIEGRESNLRLIHHAQNFNVNAFACSVRNAEYTFLFGNNHELVHAYDRRTDPGETIDLFQGKGEMRHGVEHSIRDAQEK